MKRNKKLLSVVFVLLVLFGVSIGTGISAKPEIPTLYLTTNENVIREQAAEIIATVLEDLLGINVEIRVYRWWPEYVAGQLMPSVYAFPDLTSAPYGEPQWLYSELLNWEVPVGWDMTLCSITGGIYDPAWEIFTTSNILNIGGYSNPAYEDLGAQLDALEIDWNANYPDPVELSPEARDLLFALQVQFYKNPPVAPLLSCTNPTYRYYLWFNLNNPYLSKQIRRKIRDVIPEDELLLLFPPEMEYGITSSFLTYDNPYLDPKFLPGGVFGP